MIQIKAIILKILMKIKKMRMIQIKDIASLQILIKNIN